MKMKFITMGILILSVNLTFGQIELEKSFTNESLQVYTNSSETFYYSANYNLSTVKIYNADYSLKSEFTPTIPNGMSSFSISRYREHFSLSKNIFNDDDLLEIVLTFSKNGGKIIKIYNENGVLVKDFGESQIYQFEDEFDFNIYHDKTSNENKLRLYNTTTTSTEIYGLSSSSLTTNEINQNKSIKSYPIPAKDILNIINPSKNENEVTVYDINGKILIRDTFEMNERNIKLNITNLSKGLYFYRIGEFKSKFIKE